MPNICIICSKTIVNFVEYLYKKYYQKCCKNGIQIQSYSYIVHIKILIKIIKNINKNYKKIIIKIIKNINNNNNNMLNIN